MRRTAALALALIAACDHGSVTPPDAHADGGASDAALRTITGRDVVRNIVNDTNHTPLLVEDVPLHALVLTQELPDHTLQPIDVAADGTFSFTTTEPRYRLNVGIDGAAPVEYQLSAPQLSLASRQLGRYDRDPVPANTSIAVNITNAPGGGLAAITSTGLWTQTFRSNGSNAAFTIDWSQVGSLGGPRGLLDASKNDRLYYNVFDNVGNPLFGAITSSCSTDLTLAGGMVTNVACTAAPLSASRCMHAQLRFAAEAARVNAVAGATYPNYFGNWQVQALANPTTGPVGGLLLAYLAPGGSATPPADYDHNLAFGNPYTGHDVGLLMSTGKYRMYALPAATPVTLVASTSTYVLAQPDCATSTETPAGVIALGTNTRLDGVRLDSDSISLGLTDRDHTLTWDATDGAVDYWVVRILALGVNAANATTTSTIRTYVSIERKITVDASLLPAGKSYIVDVIGVRAFPGAMLGNFHDYAFPAQPYATSDTQSGVFRVVD